MIHIEIDKQYREKHSADLLTRTVEAVLKDQQVGRETGISVVITGDKKLRELNQQFLGEDHVPDVLSFPSGESSDAQHYLGDVVISMPRARAQAKASGHRMDEELQLLTVHGLLHLLGHDHASPQEKARMWAAQEKILIGLGVHITANVSEKYPTP
ncbi:MAG: rRNA maturation RNase YbeY [Anaerolineales bacterium]